MNSERALHGPSPSRSAISPAFGDRIVREFPLHDTTVGHLSHRHVEDDRIRNRTEGGHTHRDGIYRQVPPRTSRGGDQPRGPAEGDEAEEQRSRLGRLFGEPADTAALLQDGSPADATAITAIQRVAEAYPDAVVPITTQLIAYLDGGDDAHRIGALAVLGTLSKDYPNVAEDTIPTAIKLLDADHYKLRANAAGLLADLADEYPDQVKSVVPQAIELLEDSDEKARYNATSILARVAKADLDAAKSAIKPLIDALDEDFAYTRSNACWALGYLKAEDALDPLQEVEETDPNEEVRHAASVAIDEIESR